MEQFEVDSRRLGRLIDGNKDTPENTVLLERKENEILLMVPWEHDTLVYSRWFLDQDWTETDEGLEGVYGGGKRLIPVPSSLTFLSPDGHVSLLGCEASHMKMSHPFSGLGTITVQKAVLGFSEETDFSKVHGLRTEIPSLAQWLGLAGISQTGREPDGTLGTIKVRAPRAFSFVAPEGTQIHVGMTTWINRSLDSVQVIQKAAVETRFSDSRPWEDHLNAHHALRDLLALSDWKRIPVWVTDVMHEEANTLNFQGQSLGQRWLKVVTASQDPPITSNGAGSLVKFGDLGSEGIQKWLQLRKDFARAIDPVVFTLSVAEASPEVRLSQVAVGLEAAAYLLLQRDQSKTEKQADGYNFKQRLVVMADYVRNAAPDKLVLDEAWAQRTADCYNAVKHANRVLPERQDVVKAWFECTLLFRLWIASELGLDNKVLRQRASIDSFAR